MRNRTPGSGGAAKGDRLVAASFMGDRVVKPSQRLGSSDGERKTLLIRQIASEPLPASVLFGDFGEFIALALAGGPSCRALE